MSSAASLLLYTARRGELHHSIIAHGPEPDLLRDLAVRIAKTLNCLNRTTGDDCNACVRIDRRIHPDVHFIEVAGDRKLISIEQIRDILETATQRPYEGRTKVFIIDPADALSAGGSNALLKTLEEPTRDTSFILITRSPDLLLPTIRSRSQSIYIGNDVPRDLAAPLEAVRLQQIASVTAPDQREELTESILNALHRFAAKGDSAALLSLAATVASAEDVKDAMALTAAIFCDVVGLRDDQAIDPKRIAAIRSGIDRSRLLASADALMTGIRALNVNADVRLVVEQAISLLVTG